MVIAFDIDDTLVKEREFCLSSFSVAAQICTPWLNPHEVMEVMTEALLKRENHYSALEELMEARGVSDKIDMKEIVDACRSHFPRFSTSSMDKARKWVQEVISQGHIPAIITDGRSSTQRNKLRGLGIFHLFKPEDILISEEQGADKTKPDMFRKLMELHHDEDGFVYIGDNIEKDFIWPNRLGWQTIGILDRAGTNIHVQNIQVQDLQRQNTQLQDIQIQNPEANPEKLPGSWR